MEGRIAAHFQFDKKSHFHLTLEFATVALKARVVASALPLTLIAILVIHRRRHSRILPLFKLIDFTSRKMNSMVRRRLFETSMEWAWKNQQRRMFDECSEDSVPPHIAVFQQNEIEYWRSSFIHLHLPLAVSIATKPIFRATRELDISMVQHLLSISPENVETRDDTFGATPLAMLSASWIDRNDEHKHCIALEIANLLIQRGANVNCPFMSRYCEIFTDITPVAAAVVNEDDRLVQLLLKNGADPSVEVHPMKVTPIFFAAVRESASIFDALLRSGANINHRDVDENSVLIIACAAASEVIVKIILSQNHTDKIDIHARNKRQCTALHAAVFGGSSTIIELLLKFGADVNAETAEGYTPLDIAVMLGRTSIKELLKTNKGTSKFCAEKILREQRFVFLTTTYGNVTQLHELACLNLVEPMIYFLDRGTDVNVKDIFGKTPLHHAVQTGARDAAVLLINRGADVNVEDFGGSTPLFFAVGDGCEEMVKLLLSYHARTDVLNTFQSMNVSLLHVASFVPRNDTNMSFAAFSAENEAEKMDKARIVKLLLKKYTPFDLKAQGGARPLDWAIEFEFPEVVKMLKLQDQLFACIQQANLKGLDTCVKNGAIVNCRSIKYKSPLQYAVVKGNVEIVTRLIELGADVNYALPDGVTALHYAAKFDRPQIALKLLLNGAAINAKTIKSGKTPLDVGEEEEKKDCPNTARKLLRFVQSAFTIAETGLTDSEGILALISRTRNSEGHTVSDCIASRNQQRSTE